MNQQVTQLGPEHHSQKPEVPGMPSISAIHHRPRPEMNVIDPKKRGNRRTKACSR